MNVVISGTSEGIGRASAQKFITEGHTVYGFDIQEATIQSENYHHVIHDVRNPLPDLPDDALQANIVICSAGTIIEEDAIAVNLEGTMRFVEHFVESPNLQSILFIASASARNGSEFPRYVASKAGIVAYTKNLALQVAARNIKCNSISPGGVITSVNQHILDSEELYAAVKAETLLGKWAEPEEIAEFAYFMTVVNTSMTGEDILIDNGEMLKSNFIW